MTGQLTATSGRENYRPYETGANQPTRKVEMGFGNTAPNENKHKRTVAVRAQSWGWYLHRGLAVT